jgi:hypothetical protein
VTAIKFFKEADANGYSTIGLLSEDMKTWHPPLSATERSSVDQAVATFTTTARTLDLIANGYPPTGPEMRTVANDYRRLATDWNQAKTWTSSTNYASFTVSTVYDIDATANDSIAAAKALGVKPSRRTAPLISTTAPASPPPTSGSTQLGSYNGTARNANFGPATDQSTCPGSSSYTVGQDTSCPFAANVLAVAHSAYEATGHLPAIVSTSSPVTHKIYELQCSILGYGSELVCSTVAPATGIVVMEVADVKSAHASSGGTSPFSPTPEEVAKAKQALAFCQHAQPGTTLRDLEEEAATPEGIQC